MRVVLSCIVILSFFSGLNVVKGGSRVPENCANNEELRVTSQDYTGDYWASGYRGLMYTFELGKSVLGFTIKVRFNGNSSIYTYSYKTECFPDEQCTYKSDDNPRLTALTLVTFEKRSLKIYKSNAEDDVEEVQFTFQSDQICTVTATFGDCKVDAPLKVYSLVSYYSANGSFACPSGYVLEGQDAQITRCQADGKWSNSDQVTCSLKPSVYGEWVGGACSRSCGGGTRLYTRKCIQGSCDESRTNTTSCNEFQCPVHPTSFVQGVTDCTWKTGEKSSCNFTFQSNPLADRITLYAVTEKDRKQREKVEFKYLSTSNDVNQTISITHIQDDQLKATGFELEVFSTKYRTNRLTIPFTLKFVSPRTPEPQGSGSTAIIVVVIVIAIISSAVIAVVVHKKRVRNQREYPLDEYTMGKVDEDAVSVASKKSVESRKIEV